MKFYHSLTVLFLITVFSSCKKKDAPLLTSVEGRWRLAKVDGCFSGQGADVTKKQEIVFQGNQYTLFINDVRENADTFNIKQVNNETLLTIGENQQFFIRFTTDAIILTPNLSDACIMTYGKLAY